MSKMNGDPKLEDLMNQLGRFGKYQLFQYCLHALSCLLAGLHMLAFTFIAKTPQHRCFIPEIDGDPLIRNPTFNQSILEDFIPNSESEVDSCSKFTNGFGSAITSCGGSFVFDKTTFYESRVYEWNTVCENKWQRALVQSIYVLGVGIGAMICGALSDRFGRKKVFCVAAVLQFILSLVTAFIPNYIAFCIVFFFYGWAGSGGPVIPGFILTMELLERRKRLYLGIIFGSFFSLGIVLVAIWSYFIRNIMILQIIFSLHTLILFGHWFYMDESIRWLWGKQRRKEAIEVAKKACAFNGLPFEDRDIYHEKEPEKPRNDDKIPYPEKIKQYSVLDLFRTPKIRFRTLMMSFTFFSTSLSYYGLAFNTGSLPGNPHLIFGLVGMVDWIGDFILMFIVNKVGRRTLNLSYLFIAGFANIITAFLPKGTAIIVISLIGKIACASCFRVVFNYTGEMFPTVVRNSSTGYGTLIARLAGVISPQILLLSSFDKKIPPLIIGSVALIAGLSSLFLPETLKKDLPQTIEDGENFGRGDNAFSSCYSYINDRRK